MSARGSLRSLFFVLIAVSCAKAPDFVGDLGPNLGVTYVAGEGNSLRPVVYSKSGGYAVIEGDIIVGTVEQAEEVRRKVETGGPSSRFTVAIQGRSSYWSKSTVPYTLHSSLTDDHKFMVAAAVADYNSTTPVKWIPRTNEFSYVEIRGDAPAGVGGDSYLGRQGGYFSGYQALRLNPNLDIIDVGTVLHEMGHALGLEHEHNRLDRDRYVTIKLSNVIAGQRFAFDINPSTTDIGAYDFASIMHYPRFAFGVTLKNGFPAETIVPVDGQEHPEMGTERKLSTGDIRGLEVLYDDWMPWQPFDAGGASSGIALLARQSTLVAQETSSVTGTLDVFAFLSGNALWQTRGTNASRKPSWSSYASLGGAPVRLAAVAMNQDGRAQVFVVDGNNQKVYTRYETKPASETYSDWSELGGPATALAVARNWNGKLVLAVIDGGKVFYKEQVEKNSSEWTGWYGIGGSPATDVHFGTNADGSVELFAFDRGGNVWHIWNYVSGEINTTWKKLGGSPVAQLAVERGSDGRLHLLARTTAKEVWHLPQSKPGKWEGSWTKIGIPDNETIATTLDEAGYLHLFSTDADGALWMKWKSNSDDTWSGWRRIARMDRGFVKLYAALLPRSDSSTYGIPWSSYRAFPTVLGIKQDGTIHWTWHKTIGIDGGGRYDTPAAGPVTTVLLPPSQFTVTATGVPRRLALAWTPPAGEHDAISVERSSDGGNRWIEIAKLPSAASGFEDRDCGVGFRYRLFTHSGERRSASSAEGAGVSSCAPVTPIPSPSVAPTLKPTGTPAPTSLPAARSSATPTALPSLTPTAPTVMGASRR